jgi:hypothetical protein
LRLVRWLAALSVQPALEEAGVPLVRGQAMVPGAPAPAARVQRASMELAQQKGRQGLEPAGLSPVRPRGIAM